MSKLSNTLKMLFFLNKTHGFVKIRNIANHIEIGTREVRRYRDDLEMAGFFIEEKRGRDGGYQLINKIDSILSLNQMETLLLNLNVRNNQKIFDSLNSTISFVKKMKNDLIIGDNYIDDEMLYKLYTIQQAIEKKVKIRIDYESLQYGQGKYLVEGYLFRVVRNQYYLYACHNQEVKLYKVSQITKIEETSDAYVIDQEKLEKLKNDNAFGVFRSDKVYDVIIVVASRINKQIEGFFQCRMELLEANEDCSKYRIKTYSLKEVLYTILSLGPSIKVEAPLELIQMHKMAIKDMQNIYKNV